MLVGAEVLDVEGAAVGDVQQALARGVDGEAAEVAPDPAAVELLGDGDCRSRAGEEVGHQVSRIAREVDNAFEQRFGLLRVVAEPLVTLALNRRNVRPDVLERDSLKFVQVSLLAWHSARLRLHDATLGVHFSHARLGKPPVAGNTEKLVVRVPLRGAARSGDIAEAVATPAVRLDVLVEGARVALVVGGVAHRPRSALALSVEKDRVVKTTEVTRSLADIAVGGLSLPDDLVDVGLRRRRPWRSG